MLRYSRFSAVSLLLVLVIATRAEPGEVKAGTKLHFQSRPSELSVASTNLDFGEQEVSQTLAITNLGDLDLAWQMIVSDGSKLGLSKTQGTLGAGKSEGITVNVKRGNLARGTYQAKIQVTSNGGNKEIAVSFSVPNHAPEFVDVPGKQTAYIGDTVELIIKGKDADGDSLALSIHPDFPLPEAKIELLESGDIYVWRLSFSSDKPGAVPVRLILDDGQP